MMRKVLVLALVLGVASLATAGLSISADGSDTFGINSDADGSTDIYIIVDAALGADLVYTNVIGGSLSSSVDYDVLFGGPFAPNANLGVSISGDPVSYVELATVADSTAPVAAGLWATVQVPGASFATTGETAVAWVTDTGTGAILATAYLVPEPATMALLGLGALLLRRKK